MESNEFDTRFRHQGRQAGDEIPRAIALLMTTPLAAQEQEVVPEPPMTIPRLTEIIATLDPEGRLAGAQFQLTIEDVPVTIITDPRADRVRAIVPTSGAYGMDAAELIREMRANSDTALDARYAIGQGRLWATIIHPLSPTEKHQLISGLRPVANLGGTYGSHCTGGDSGGLQRELIDKLLKKGEEI